MCIIRFIHLMALICQSVHCENALFSSINQCCFLQPDALQEIFHPEIKILSLFTLVSNPYDFSSTQRENCNEAFKFQKECKNTKSSLCVLDFSLLKLYHSFVWQTNKYLSCYSLIIFSSVSCKLLHPELLSSRICFVNLDELIHWKDPSLKNDSFTNGCFSHERLWRCQSWLQNMYDNTFMLLSSQFGAPALMQFQWSLKSVDRMLLKNSLFVWRSWKKVI